MKVTKEIVCERPVMAHNNDMEISRIERPADLLALQHLALLPKMGMQTFFSLPAVVRLQSIQKANPFNSSAHKLATKALEALIDFQTS